MHAGRSDGKRDEFFFVDNVRFWSMFCVIAVHCLGLAVAGETARDQATMTILMGVPLKQGTIGFFLISGFLLGHRIQTSPRLEYLGRRVKRVFVPWLMWSTLAVVDLCWHRRLEFLLGAHGWRLLGRQWVTVLVHSPFWFIPNLMIGLCLLLVFRKYLYDLRLGAGLWAVNLFYTVNIYGRWVPSEHNEALLGFVFYLWLGSYGAHRFASLRAWLATVSMRAMAVTVAVLEVCAYGEAFWMQHVHAIDTLNTLRLTNQCLAVAIVLMLVKVKRRTWPRFLDARRDTFGLYLSHSQAMELGMLFLQATVARHWPAVWSSREGVFLLWPALFVMVYAMALGVTRVLGAWPATSWLVGVEGVRKQEMLRLREDQRA